MGRFYITVWDPRLIIAQIITTQTCYYAFLSILLLILDLCFGQQISLDQIFDPKVLSFASSRGRITIISFAINAFVGGMSMVWIVERAKKCLDFTLTSHLIHLLACWFIYGSPGYVWLLTNTISAIIQCLLGEYLCMNRELKEISLAGSLVMQV
eukprot:TRINITY_DN8024_c0_g1_i1.p1 TRINITY_DN8024_c0_g1~~TRINITY_DN8024_c0_g1_i1.p1  ORF type:complete len:177 (-),score=22.40 TRINITY_DN8024_c0_g1_i1:53-514(-)